MVHLCTGTLSAFVGEKNSLMTIDQIYPFGIFVGPNNSTHVYLLCLYKVCPSLYLFGIWDELALNFQG